MSNTNDQSDVELDEDLLNDEDDDLNEGGDEDRGDDVDTTLSDDDADADDDAGADQSEGGEPSGEEPDMELLAELAGESGKAKMVPHARFNEVNETLKQERAERLRLEEELARTKGQKAAAPEEQPDDKPKVYDFDAAEERFMDALLDGDKEVAAKIRNEIRTEERKQFAQEAANSAKQITDEESRNRAAEAQQVAANKVLTAAITKYPFLDHEGAEANADAIEDVIARRDLYIKQGVPFAKALAQAVEKVAPRYVPQDKPSKLGRNAGATTEQINRNLDREKRIPAAMPGVGERGKDIDYAKLSEDEFDALPEAEKRKARGDFVKEGA